MSADLRPPAAPARPRRRARGRVFVALVALPLTLLGARAVSLVGATSASATGAFTVKDGQITDPDGRAFVPVGVNLGGPHSWIAQATKGSTTELAAWGFNTVRLVMCAEPTCDMYGNGWTGQPDNADLDSIVQELTARHIVVMLELHNIAPGELPTADQTKRLGDWWASTAATYASNPYVWFNLLNEPGSAMPAPAAWLDVHDALLARIRSAGSNNVVVVDGSQWGQDAQWGGALDTSPVQSSASAILTYGPDLLKRHSNVVFSIHPYTLWGGQGTDQQRIDRFTDFYTRVRAFGGGLLIGEVGSGSATDPSGLAARAAYGFAANHPVGVISWTPPGAFAVVNPSGSFEQIDDLQQPTNLNWLGRLAWDHAHALAAAGNPQPIAAPVGVVSSSSTFEVDSAGWAAIGDASAVRAAGALQVVGGASATVRWSPSAGSLAPGGRYVLRGRLRAAVGNDAVRMTFHAFDNNGQSLATTVGNAWARAGWSEIVLTFVAPNSAWSQAFVDFSMATPSGFVLDDVRIERIDGSTAPPTTAAATTVATTIPRTTVVTTVPPTTVATTVATTTATTTATTVAPTTVATTAAPPTTVYSSPSSSSSVAAVPPTSSTPTTVAPVNCSNPPIAAEHFDRDVLPLTIWSDDHTSQLTVANGKILAAGAPASVGWLPQASVTGSTGYRVCATAIRSLPNETLTVTVRQWDEQWTIIGQVRRTIPSSADGALSVDVVTGAAARHLAVVFEVLNGTVAIDDLALTAVS